jgi:hypothetical protein
VQLVLHRADRDEQQLGDVPVGQPAGSQRRNLPLAAGEHIRLERAQGGRVSRTPLLDDRPAEQSDGRETGARRHRGPGQPLGQGVVTARFGPPGGHQQLLGGHVSLLAA